MIALVVVLLCARVVLAGLGSVIGLVLAVVGIAIELSYATLRWVVYPIAVGAWWVFRRVFVGGSAGAVVPPVPPRLRHSLTHRAPASQRALLAGVRAARA